MDWVQEATRLHLAAGVIRGALYDRFLERLSVGLERLTPEKDLAQARLRGAPQSYSGPQGRVRQFM